jgi:non-ribosomal peptide synthase protein (TIGR01720 family)
LNANGKLDWRALPVPEQGRSELVAEFVAPVTERELRLAEVWCRVLGLPQVGIHDNFFELGGDSLLGMRMIALAHKVDVHLTAKQLIQYQTISELLEVATDSPLALAEQGPVTGSFPLVPMQSWALKHWPWKNPHRWNFAYMFEAPHPLDYQLLRQTLDHLVRHHDGLRVLFERGPAGWQASLPAPNDVSPLSWIDLSALPESEQSAAISARANALQDEINLFTGQGFRIGYFHLGPDRPGRLLILLHLLVADAFSLRIMLHDIQVVYTQLQRGEEVRMPEKTTSLKRWAERLSEYVASPEMQQEAAEYWLKLPWHRVALLPVDHPEKRGHATTGGVRKIFRALNSAETADLLTVVTPDVSILDILFSALLHAFTPLIGARPLHFGVRELGRQTAFDDVEPPANTVARFSLDRLLLLYPGESGELADTLQAVIQQMAAVPQRGIGHDLITYMSQDPDLVEAMCCTIPPHEILLNHTGQMQQAFTLPEGVGILGGLAPEDPGPVRDPGELLDFPIFLFSTFGGDQFRLTCEYSSELFEQTTIEQFVERYLEAIRVLTRHLQTKEQ